MNGRRSGTLRVAPVALTAARAFLWSSGTPDNAAAQGLRGWVGSSIQMVEMRPLAMDTVPLSLAVIDRNGRAFVDGRVVSCVLPDACLGYRALEQVRTVAASQDLNLTAWGFGLRGLSFTTLLRTRQRGGSSLVWPRSDDAFDAMLAYAQLVHGNVRVRAGRQEVRSNLGFPAFDGGSVAWTTPRVQLEAYGGRSLARGLRDPASDILRGLEDFVPDKSVVLLGLSARTWMSGTSVTGRYQREVYADRSGLESERVSLAFSTVLSAVRILGSLDYDLAFAHWGKGDLAVAMPFAGNRLEVQAAARRYIPYFSLSTIWGFFEPVSYTEGEVRLSWAPASRLGVWGSASLRRYGDTSTTVVFARLVDTGKRASFGARFRPAPSWSVEGAYRLEYGAGATLSSGDAAVRWTPSDRVSIAVNGMSFQQIEEFRLGEGRAWGGGFTANLGITERTSLSGGLSVIRQETTGGSVDTPWNQTRAWSSLRIPVGGDPGTQRGRAR